MSPNSMKLSEVPSCVDRVKTWQRYLKSKGAYSGAVSGTFDEATDNATGKYGLKIHARGDDVLILSFDRPDRDHFKYDPGVVPTDAIRQVVPKIAYGYYVLTGDDSSVTSGLRKPEKQAGLIYDKARHGKKALDIYKNKKMADEIWTAYDNGRKNGTGEQGAIDAITAIIRDGMSRHEYISRHLTGRAFDVRKSTRSCAIESFEAVVKAVFGSVQGHLIEHEPGGQPHLHVQF